MVNYRQLGRFVIERRMVLDECDKIASLIMPGLVVVRAECKFDRDGIEYTAIGPDFAPVDEGDEAPWYVPILQYDGMGGCKLKCWERT